MTEWLRTYQLSSTGEISGLIDQLEVLAKEAQFPENLVFDTTLIVDV